MTQGKPWYHRSRLIEPTTPGLPGLMQPVRIQLAISTASVLVGHLNPIRDQDTTCDSPGWRRRVCLQVLHLDVAHHSFLTLGQCEGPRCRVPTRGLPTIPTPGVTTPTTNSLEITGIFVCRV